MSLNESNNKLCFQRNNINNVILSVGLMWFHYKPCQTLETLLVNKSRIGCFNHCAPLFAEFNADFPHFPALNALLIAEWLARKLNQYWTASSVFEEQLLTGGQMWMPHVETERGRKSQKEMGLEGGKEMAKLLTVLSLTGELFLESGNMCWQLVTQRRRLHLPTSLPFPP